ALRLAISLALLFAISCSHTTRGANMAENQKIESLIASVENFKDAKFIRNGKEYDSKAAADHMRSKWRYAGGRIKTARDFIQLVASKSSESGQPYLIRFKDGKEITSEQFLTDQLKRLEGSGGKQSATP